MLQKTPVAIPPTVNGLFHIAHHQVESPYRYGFLDQRFEIFPLETAGILELIEQKMLVTITDFFIDKRRLIIFYQLAQQLLRRKGGGRVAALEILFGTPALSSLIREGKTHQIAGLIGQGRSQGMVGMDDSLRSLVERDVIEPHAALEKALEKDEMRKWLKERGAALPDDAE